MHTEVGDADVEGVPEVAERLCSVLQQLGLVVVGVEADCGGVVRQVAQQEDLGAAVVGARLACGQQRVQVGGQRRRLALHV